jgi:DHA1 family bicyclomycin/chloramphenicol resistance-like MFS transporter
MRHGVDATLGFGAAVMAGGGIAMVLAVAFGLASAAALVLPMALYLSGLGMVLPQAIAGAMTPFPERAGAASAFLGFVQQSAAALCGAVVGMLLGATAWPLAAMIAAMGCATLVLWIATRALRARAVKH